MEMAKLVGTLRKKGFWLHLGALCGKWTVVCTDTVMCIPSSDMLKHVCLDMSRAVIWQVSAPWAEKDLHYISKLYVQDGAAASNALHDKVEG